MAYLTKKHGRNYIRDYRKEPRLDNNGLPVKDDSGNIVYKNVNIWIKSSKDDKLAKIELGKYEEDKDRARIGLDKKYTSWHDIKEKYLNYSKATKAKTGLSRLVPNNIAVLQSAIIKPLHTAAQFKKPASFYLFQPIMMLQPLHRGNNGVYEILRTNFY